MYSTYGASRLPFTTLDGLVIWSFSERWLPLVDLFRNKEIDFGFSLQNIQTVFESLQIYKANFA